MKRDKLDDVFSKLIRERSDYNCEECGTNYRYRPQGLHCSHFWTRSNKSTRWHPENACAHCYGCHRKLSGSPVTFTDRIKQFLGNRFDLVRRYTHAPVKFSKLEREDIYRFYKKELLRVQDLRASGVCGRIEFSTAPLIDLKLREIAAREL